MCGIEKKESLTNFYFKLVKMKMIKKKKIFFHLLCFFFWASLDEKQNTIRSFQRGNVARGNFPRNPRVHQFYPKNFELVVVIVESVEWFPYTLIHTALSVMLGYYYVFFPFLFFSLLFDSSVCSTRNKIN